MNQFGVLPLSRINSRLTFLIRYLEHMDRMILVSDNAVETSYELVNLTPKHKAGYLNLVSRHNSYKVRREELTNKIIENFEGKLFGYFHDETIEEKDVIEIKPTKVTLHGFNNRAVNELVGLAKTLLKDLDDWYKIYHRSFRTIKHYKDLDDKFKAVLEKKMEEIKSKEKWLRFCFTELQPDIISRLKSKIKKAR